MNNLFIPILLGTGREGRFTEKAARFVFEQAREYGFETELIDPRDFLTAPATNGMSEENSKKWSDIMTRADGLIIVSPEYNHGYPGELKMMLDELYKEYNRKPAAICSAGGGLGGSRMVEVLRIALIELQMIPIRSAVYFSNIKNLFDETGAIRDESYREKVKKLFEEMEWYARTLKEARERI